MLPNRWGSTGSYRYGFQGQERDDEIKGEGNSINYTFRMHDPRVGRFFAVDPLTSKYPWNSPYSFSENKLGLGVELEGLELGDWKYIEKYNSPVLNNQNTEDAKKQIEAYQKADLTAGAIAFSFYVDLYIFKGKVTTELLKQFGVNIAFNAADQFLSEKKISPTEIIKDAFLNVDFADSTIDVGLDVLIDKTKFGKLKTAIEIIAPSLIDVSAGEGIQTVGVNKNAHQIIGDMVFNYFSEKSDGLLSKGKFTNNEVVKKITDYILGNIEQTIKDFLSFKGKIDKYEKTETIEKNIDNTNVDFPQAPDINKIKRYNKKRKEKERNAEEHLQRDKQQFIEQG